MKTKTIIKITIVKTIIKIGLFLYFSNAFAQNLPLALPQSIPQGLPALTIEATKPQQQQDEINFNQITLNNLLTVIFTEIETKNFVLSPQVLNDTRLVSFRYNKKKNGSIVSFMTPMLQDLGYTVLNRNGTIYIEPIPQKKSEDYNYFVYIPKFRTADYLSKSIKPYFKEYLEASTGQVQTDKPIDNNLASGSVMNYADKQQDFLTFKYDNEKIKSKILEMVKQIDIEESNLIARAYVYEVSYSNADGSAMGLMLNLANDKLKLNLGSTNSLQDFVSFSSSALSLFVSSLDTNSNIKMISNPILRIKNNKESKFIVGNSVPTLGNITTTASGTTQQSVNYIDTGLTFKITPIITKDSISIDLTEEISDAVKTETGVNNSPTLTKRNLQTTFTTKKNEVVMLSALTQDKKGESTSRPFLLPFFTNHNDTKSKTDIVIFFEILETSSMKLAHDSD
ncbi:MAG: hypothetical protein JZU58_08755 [Curvibacter lanceolatus]|uniref:type II secretion system protein GspD n=1 Tax=Curvibacter lanceolatus TaxID=86182 RepID=UPI002355379D|nr:hypothetical protein [Curvibacter lanceolatus]MBV5292432.1 hypothetical protein [Curvibacter lanceolatus]